MHKYMLIDWIIIGIEVLIIALIGNGIAKISYGWFLGLIRRVTKRTRFTLDDYLLQYLEHPLRIGMMVLSILIVSGLIPNLSVVQQSIFQYGIAILIMLTAYALAEAIGAILRWYYESARTTGKHEFDLSLLPFIRKITRLIFLVIGTVIALSFVGVDVSGLLAVTSVGVLILGLASQESLANIFAGLVLQLDRPAQYGDYVRTPQGDILRLQKIGSRSSKLLDLEGNTVVLSNSELAKQRLTTLSRNGKGFRATIQVEIPIRKSFSETQKIIVNALSSENKKEASTRDPRISIERMSKDAYLISISFMASDADDFISTRHHIHEILLVHAQK